MRAMVLDRPGTPLRDCILPDPASSANQVLVRVAACGAAIVFAPVGSLVPTALAGVRKGGTDVLGGIHMSDVPSMPYSLLWGERFIRSVANLTRPGAKDFLAPRGHSMVETRVVPLALSDANIALARLRAGELTGAAALVP